MNRKTPLSCQGTLALKEGLQLSITADCCDVIFIGSGDLVPMLIGVSLCRSAKGFFVICTVVALTVVAGRLKSQHVVPPFSEYSPKMEVAATRANHPELPVEEPDAPWRKVPGRKQRYFGPKVALNHRCIVAGEAKNMETNFFVSFNRLWQHIVVTHIRAG